MAEDRQESPQVLPPEDPGASLDAGARDPQEARRRPGRPAWERVKAMMRLEPGISVEIASDTNSTTQAFMVAALAHVVALLLMAPLALLTLPLTLVGLAITAGMFCLFSRVFADSVPDYLPWFRVALFASAPSALGIIPILGSIAGGIYVIVLQIIAIRDLARISPGAAIVVWLIGALLPLILIGTAALALGVATFFDFLPPLIQI